MAKFNVVQKDRRAHLAERKRAIHGDPVTGKLKIKPQLNSVSGKRKRKLFKKWRREQKEALEKGIVSMEDVEMAVAEGTSLGGSGSGSSKATKKIHLKKNLKLKKMKNKGKKKRQNKNYVEAMEE